MKKIEPFGPIYDEIERRIRKEFGEKPEIQQDVPRFGEVKKLPAFFIEMADIDPLPDPGTGEIELKTRWEIRVLISPKQDRPKIVARNASARIGALFNEKVLVEGCYPAEYQGASDDNFDLKVPLYESWVNNFEIKIRVGEDDWDTWEFYEENLEWEKYLDREFMKDKEGSDEA